MDNPDQKALPSPFEEEQLEPNPTTEAVPEYHQLLQQVKSGFEDLVARGIVHPVYMLSDDEQGSSRELVGIKFEKDVYEYVISVTGADAAQILCNDSRVNANRREALERSIRNPSRPVDPSEVNVATRTNKIRDVAYDRLKELIETYKENQVWYEAGTKTAATLVSLLPPGPSQ